MAPATERIDVLQRDVEKLVERSPAFHALPEHKRKEFVEHLARTLAYVAAPEAEALAQKQPDAVEQTKLRLSEKPGEVGAEFKAGAMHQGVEEFGNLVQKVDFPKFVSGLVQGVFQAIVNASIQQMQAYGELLAATAKSTQDFADDHISDAQARDHLANTNPGLFQVDTSGDSAKLALRDGVDPAEVAAKLGQEVDLADEEQEQNLVNQAKIKMAQQKQQNLAMMVLLGINRIVVTDGKINAKVVFDIQASDTAKRHATAEMHDAQKSSTSVGSSTGFLTNLVGGYSASHSDDHATTVASAIDDTSESKAQMKAQLSGDVHIAFKSETFPLEKMVDVMGMQAIKDKSQPTPIGPRGTPPPTATSAPAGAPPPPTAAAAPAPGAAR
jgi:hypothetical protein